MNILWLSPRWPYPDDTGARKATLTLLSQVVKAGEALGVKVNLDFVCYKEDGTTEEQIRFVKDSGKFRDSLILDKPKSFLGSQGLSYIKNFLLTNDQPFTMSRYGNTEVKSQFQVWSQNKTWDFTVLDGLHAAGLAPLSDKKLGQIIYRAHNVETEIWRQMADQQKHFLKRQVFQREFHLYRDFEMKICERSSYVFPVSDLDVKKFREYGVKTKMQSLPIGVNILSEPLPFPNEEGLLKLLFVGRLDWHPNRQGLEWFLKEVWPEVSAKRKASLTIVGSGESSWLDSWIQNSNVKLFRNVPDLKPLYQDCDLTLIPLFMGSGTRVKAIESGSYGRTYISTAVGVEGLPITENVDYLRAENRDEWVNLLLRTPQEEMQSMGEHLYKTIRANFDQAEVAQKFVNHLRG